MSLKRKLLMAAGAVMLPLSSAVFILGTTGQAGAVTKFDDSGDTVACSSVVNTKLTIQPALNAGTTDTTTPTVIKVAGKLFGCQDGLGQLNAKNNTFDPAFEGVFTAGAGLAGHGTSVLNLQGCSADAGSLTETWLATAGATETLLYPHSVIAVSHAYGSTFNPDGLAAGTSDPFGTDNMTTDGYGSFSIGEAALVGGGDGGTCTSSGTATVPDAFNGGDNGATSSVYATTEQDFSVFTENQEDNATLTTSTILLGMGEAFFG